MELRHGAVLFDIGSPLNYLVFPDRRTMVSLICANAEGELTEVGIVGSEGMIGVNMLLGSQRSSHRALVQIPGAGWRIKASAASKAFAADGVFRSACLRYVNFLLLQLSQTALCNRLHSAEERLARWLLLCADRGESGELPLTHEMLSHMLGTRRATVTLTAATFQEAGLVRYQRGRITILDHKNLEQAACTCFQAQQADLKRLLDGA